MQKKRGQDGEWRDAVDKRRMHLGMTSTTLNGNLQFVKVNENVPFYMNQKPSLYSLQDTLIEYLYPWTRALKDRLEREGRWSKEQTTFIQLRT